VTNQAPVLQPIPNQTITGPVFIDLVATDGDSDPLTYSASIRHAGYELGRQLGLTLSGSLLFNANGLQEKWLRGGAGAGPWYFVLPNGNLYRYLGSGPIGNNQLVGPVGIDAYNDPSLLYDSSALSRIATLTVVGDQLQIQPAATFVGTFRVEATVSDGVSTNTVTFTVQVAAAGQTADAALDPHASGGSAPLDDTLALDQAFEQLEDQDELLGWLV
jgi:hypothetical protein